MHGVIGVGRGRGRSRMRLAVVAGAVAAGLAVAASPAGAATLPVLEPTADLAPVPLSVSRGGGVAIKGDTAVVADAEAGTVQVAGSVRVLTRSGATWTQVAVLTAGQVGDSFGHQVALARADDGHSFVLAVSDPGVSGASTVRVYVGSGSHWTQRAVLSGSDTTPGDGFGESLAASADAVLVGAPRATGGGAVYVFGGNAWTQQLRLTGGDTAPGDNFGQSMSLADGTLVVGAPGHSPVDALTGLGAVYTFTGNGRHWAQRSELVGQVSHRLTDLGEGLGVAVSVSADGVLAVETLEHASGTLSFNTGAVYVYTGGPAHWTRRTVIDALTLGLAYRDLYDAIAVTGSTVLVSENGRYTGAAWVFTRSGSTWGPSAQLDVNPALTGPHTGVGQIAVSGSTALVAAYDHDTTHAFTYSVPAHP